MAASTKKNRKNRKTTGRPPTLKKSAERQNRTIEELGQKLAECLKRENATAKELQERNRQLREALEQQTAADEVLRVISSSPTDVLPVFDTIVRRATTLCEASFGVAHRFDGELITFEAHYNMTPDQVAQTARRFPCPATRDSASGRAILDRQVIHIEDVCVDPEYSLFGGQASLDFHTVLAVPLLKDGLPIGTLGMWRREVRAFTQSQINLAKTFAAQAVIAIENVRLFKELTARNQELTEALEQQSTTGEILRVIASSPTDVQPVLDAVVQSAARLCEANDAQIGLVEGNEFVRVTRLIPTSDERTRPVTRDRVSGRAYLDRQTIHIADLQQELAEFPESERHARTDFIVHTVLATPLLREDTPIGVIIVRRTDVRPFSDKQIALIKTFANQAVIAIENARLFKQIQERNLELREALEHQTATAEVLGIISRSPTDVQPVLDAIVESAAKVCGIDDVVLRLRAGTLWSRGLILVTYPLAR